MQLKDTETLDLTFGFTRQPASQKFIRLSRPMMIGDVVCDAGAVLEVQPATAKPSSIMPVDPRLYHDRATKMIDKKLAAWHPGPATVEVGHSTSIDKTLAGLLKVEKADMAPQIKAQAETATRRPQRGAM